MKITDININLVTPRDGLIAFASMVLDNSIFISGIGIHKKRNQKGYRLTYPTRKSLEQVFNIYHPINKKTSEAIEVAVFNKLNDVLNKGCSDVGYSRN